MDKRSPENCKDKILYFSPNDNGISYFTNALIYIGEHNEEGSLGLIINRPLEITTKQFYESMGIKVTSNLAQKKLLMGGPVNPGAVFILHSADTEWDSTMLINEHISLSTSKDILEAIAIGNGPVDYLITLGYSGWESHQLDEEIFENAWISAPLDYRIIFKMEPEDKIKGLSDLLGFNVEMVSPNPGNA